MKAVIESAGGVASRASIGSHELVFDQPDTVPGGHDAGPSPLDVLAVSVAACAHYYAAAFLFGRHIPTDGLKVEVEAEKSKEPVPRISKLVMRVLLPAGIPAQYLPAIERAVKHCPAYGTMLHSPTVELTFSSPDAEPRVSAA
jgi:uncharacterized OsmC-like protein